MQPSPEGRLRSAWGRLTYWVRHHSRIVRLASLTAGVAAFLIFLPLAMQQAFWGSLQSNKILSGLLLVFSLVAISLVWTTGQKLDAWAFLIFNIRGPRPIWLDRIMLGFTQLGSGITALGIALILFLFNDRLLAYELVLGTLTLWLVVEMVKFLVHRSRPFIRMTQTRIIGFRAVGRSFPSGHTSQVFFTAALMSQHFHASIWIVFLLYATAFLVGITRMYVGAHYPRDVLAGAILGSAWGLLWV